MRYGWSWGLVCTHMVRAEDGVPTSHLGEFRIVNGRG